MWYDMFRQKWHLMQWLITGDQLPLQQRNLEIQAISISQIHVQTWKGSLDKLPFKLKYKLWMSLHDMTSFNSYL